MALADDIKSNVKKILSEKWETRQGQVVPSPEKLYLKNEAVELEGTVLYADLDGSTYMVDNNEPWFSAEVYKSYLWCCAKIIKDNDGVITAYDGDRIMAVYIGDRRNSNAAQTALKINYAVQKIINPSIKEQYSNSYEVKQVVGIDTSNLFVTRTGVRGDNDLVWVGRAANYAAKMTSLSSDTPSWISEAVYKKINKDTKFTDGKNMWVRKKWTSMNDFIIYSSSWIWPI
ncbi:MAG TPA: adenylate/guanylate cyclase domain-containing protein [Bacteroidetes bacterium]|nr:adenylate/guanylate cyclase domain-containing protein [Bacteroidota bacterium]HEX03759.1 adenylate/guanylate cyclase domain-containing protein [Bacteroidota bacterium]